MSSILITILIIIVTTFLLKKYFSGGKNSLKTDMSQKLVIITGASSGLGYYQAKNLIESNATVIFACRNESKAKKAIATLPKEKHKNAIFMQLDLCSFESIQKFANKIKEKFPNKIDILTNNAGAQPTNFSVTKDNLESFLQGNHLGPMYLTSLLLDHFKPQGRIINLSSLATFIASLTEKSVDILSNTEKIKQNYFQSIVGKYLLYNDTKLMNLYFTSYLNDLLEKKNIPIKTCCLHPGVCFTNFWNYMEYFGILKYFFMAVRPLVYIFFKTGEEGAQTQIYLSHLEYEKIKGGAYYADCQVHFKSRKGRNMNIRNAIMKWSIEELKKRVDLKYFE